MACTLAVRIEGFERISSRKKWLFSHGRKKWRSTATRRSLGKNDFLIIFFVTLTTGWTKCREYGWRFGYERDGVAKGWLRASHRELDPPRSAPLRPWHSHTRPQKVRPGEIVPVEIEIWPSATFFEPGSTLQVTVHRQDVANYPAFRHRKLVNRGWHTVFTGGTYDSCLTVPQCVARK
jgi:hypothetical protein